jgi:outer membrane receptor protein involved in Fe transport
MVYKGLHRVLIASCRQSKTLSILLLILVLLQQIPLSAQENWEDESADHLIDEELAWLRAEAFISIATGISQPLHRAPAIASVITAADMEAMGITELDEALETVPGLHVLRNPFIGYSPIYAIRGIYSDFNPEVLLLINGIPVTSAVTGGRGVVWGGLTVNNIARIEVIRGPGSAVYGANAFAGVINVITKTSEEFAGTEAGVRAGRFDTQEYWALHGGKWGGFDVALALEYFTTEGQREEIDVDFQTALDGLFAIDPPASLAPGPVNLGADRLEARVDISRGVWRLRLGYQGRHNLQNAAGVGQALDPGAEYGYDRINADLTYHDPKFTDHWDVTAQASFLDTGWETETEQTITPSLLYLRVLFSIPVVPNITTGLIFPGSIRDLILT